VTSSIRLIFERRRARPRRLRKRNRELAPLHWNAGLRVEVMKVEGHGKNLPTREQFNWPKPPQKCPKGRPLVPSLVWRRQSTKRARRGAVPFEGQDMTIYVDKGELLRPQRVN
jgi:hypothetical protein